METTFKTFIPATKRAGIPASIQVIVNRHKQGKTATSIVAPPRYGKSDIIRLSAMELVQTGHACAALALVPWDNLADQLVSTDKTTSMVQRYMTERLPDMPDLFVAGRIKMIHDTFHETSTLQHLFTATIQLAKLNISAFQSWVNRCMFYGERPIVYIDEGHLLSSQNNWGDIAKVVIGSGAHIVLLTGTPYRSDSKPIPGFEVVTIKQEDIQRTISKRIDDEKILVSFYEGLQTEQILKPNYEVTLAQAWAVGALCKIDTKWIDSTLEIDSVEQNLSSLKRCEALRYLRPVVMNKKTIHASMVKAIEDMHARRCAGMRDSAIIVVTASDMSDDEDFSDGDVNFHARRVRDEIKIIDPTLQVLIATQADDKSEKKQKAGKANLKRFSEEGVGDVLIVKNMGTVGLDCPRIKTVVLMGTTRQLATWTQTILRGATTFGNVAYFTLILTDDIRNQENWNFIVRGQGGDVSTVTDLKLVHEDVINKKKEDEAEPTFDVLHSEYVRTEDSHNKMMLTDEGDVYAVISRYPVLRERMSAVEIGALIQTGAINVPSSKSVAKVGVVDTGSECEQLRGEINSIAKDFASNKADYGKDKKAWVEVLKMFHNKVKDHAGITKKLEKENDPAKLRVARDYCVKIVRGANHAG